MTELVVIGGSAGALEPLFALVAALPAGYPAPIVVVIHLSPTHDSRLAALLAGPARRPCCEVEDKLPLVAGAIYVAPPNYHVLVERRGHLALSVDAPVHWSRPSIDVLFESAAESFGARATGVVLSGASDDGSQGLARIAAAGGAAFVQADAVQTIMPAAALRRVPSARALPAAAIGRALAERGSPP